MKLFHFTVPILLLLATAGVVQAQEIRAGRTRQMARRAEAGYSIAAISPDGRKLLLTTSDYRGIFLMPKRRGPVQMINDIPGAGFEASFSDDGRYLFFRSDDFQGRRKLSSLMRYELATGKTMTVVPETRNLTSPKVSGNRLFYLAEGQLESRYVDNMTVKASGSDTVVLLEDLTPVLCINDRKKILKPNGEGSYIWASLSPDKTKILYYFTGKGTFICDLDGNILFTPGRINAPKWLNDRIVIGMDDRDDGYHVTASEIISYSLSSGKTTYLTSTPSEAEMFPFPFPDGRSIAFQTVEGKLYFMKLSIKK